MADHKALHHVVEPDFRQLFDHFPTPYLVLAPDFTIVAANPAYLHRSQTARDEILGHQLFDVFQDESHAPNMKAMANLRASLTWVLQHKASDTMAVQKYDMHGTDAQARVERYWSAVNTPVINAQGEITHIIHRVDDVTQFMQLQSGTDALSSEISAQAMEVQGANQSLKEANVHLDHLVAVRSEELKAEREYLHSLLMAVPVPVSVLLGPEHRYYLENDAHKGLSSGRDLMGRTFREAVPDAIDDVLPILDRVFQTGKPYQVERQRIVWDAKRTGTVNEYFYDLSWHPLFGTDGKVAGVITATIDVTTQVHAEKATRAALNALEQERALREQFVLALTHDLRTPLAAAQMGAYLISRKAHDAVEVIKLMSRIIRNLDRIDEMIRDLLDANLIRAGKKLPIEVQACELRMLVSEVLDELTTVHGNRFIFQAGDDINGYWSVNAIRRALENLCGNAIKYGAPGGSVTVTLLRTDGPRIIIAVHNEGPAIPDHDQAGIFEPFRRNIDTDSKLQKGWGLGLTLVRGIAEAHGGTAEVESSPETGTIFRITLPLDARRGD